jgi:hypothetical protein
MEEVLDEEAWPSDMMTFSRRLAAASRAAPAHPWTVTADDELKVVMLSSLRLMHRE